MKTIIIIATVLTLIGITGCAGNTDFYKTESLYPETTLEFSGECSSVPEEINEKEEESLREGWSEATVSEKAVETTVSGTNSSLTTSMPVNTPAESQTAGISSKPPATSSQQPEPIEPAEPTDPVYTQKDYDDIIRIVRGYAEIQTKIKFIWKPVMQKDGSGYHGTPNLNKSGKDGVIRTLKYHVDLTADVLTDPANGLTSDTVEYNIVWYEQDRYFFEEPGKDIYFALIYG